MRVAWIGDDTSDVTSQHYLKYSEGQTAVVKVVPCLVAAVLAHPGTNHKFFLRVRALDCSKLLRHLEECHLLACSLEQLLLKFQPARLACKLADAVRLAHGSQKNALMLRHL